MRQIVVFILLSLGSVYAAKAAVPFEQLFYKGVAIPFYIESIDPSQQLFIAAAKRGQLAEQMTDLVNRSLMIKTNIGIGFESCGAVNAFFTPQRRAIVICSEFLELMAKTAKNDSDFMMKLPRESFAKVFDGLIWGIFFHELAHAVIYTNTVPVTGREEDVADQFSVWYSFNFINLDKTPTIFPSIWFWSRLAKERSIPSMSEEERRHYMSNEHSLDEQRIYNLACWALGTGTEGGAKTAAFAQLPAERAQRCPREYAQVDQGMRTQFKKYFKTKPLRGNW